MNKTKLTGLIAVTPTPFHQDGSLNLAVVETQAAHLLKNGVKSVFIGGTAGESHLLALEERRGLARRWSGVARGTELKVIGHVGSNCLAAAALAPPGCMGAAKVVRSMLGVDLGPARLPNGNLGAAQVTPLRCDLEALGFFDWLKH